MRVKIETTTIINVRELRAEYQARGFSGRDQLVAMRFCQLAQARSLREIRDGLKSCEV